MLPLEFCICSVSFWFWFGIPSIRLVVTWSSCPKLSHDVSCGVGVGVVGPSSRPTGLVPLLFNSSWAPSMYDAPSMMLAVR